MAVGLIALGNLDTWTLGRRDTCTLGHLDIDTWTWTHGHMDTWTPLLRSLRTTSFCNLLAASFRTRQVQQKRRLDGCSGKYVMWGPPKLWQCSRTRLRFLAASLQPSCWTLSLSHFDTWTLGHTLGHLDTWKLGHCLDTWTLGT